MPEKAQQSMLRLALTLTTLLVCAGSALAHTVAPAKPIPPPDLAAKVEALMQARVRVRSFSGTILLARDGKVLLAKGYGLANADTYPGDSQLHRLADDRRYQRPLGAAVLRAVNTTAVLRPPSPRPRHAKRTRHGHSRTPDSIEPSPVQLPRPLAHERVHRFRLRGIRQPLSLRTFTPVTWK
jgi:hypothetical protein